MNTNKKIADLLKSLQESLVQRNAVREELRAWIDAPENKKHALRLSQQSKDCNNNRDMMIIRIVGTLLANVKDDFVLPETMYQYIDQHIATELNLGKTAVSFKATVGETLMSIMERTEFKFNLSQIEQKLSKIGLALDANKVVINK
jgi:hypothetical protein